MNLLITFILLNVINVIIQTIKSLVTVKSGKVVASIINAIAYGLYTVVVVYMVCDLPLWLKATIIGLANLFGVYIVKLFEEKMQKDRLWKIECSIRGQFCEEIQNKLNQEDLSYNFIKTNNNYYTFNIFSKTQEESKKVKSILNSYKAKYFVSETKIL